MSDDQRGPYTAPQWEAMSIIFADGWQSPCGHPAPVSITADAEGTAFCHDCGNRITLAELKGTHSG